jgi:hypothetical protein
MAWLYEASAIPWLLDRALCTALGNGSHQLACFIDSLDTVWRGASHELVLSNLSYFFRGQDFLKKTWSFFLFWQAKKLTLASCTRSEKTPGEVPVIF